MILGQDHDISDMESATDGADVSNANEFDDDIKEEPADVKKDKQTNDVNEPEATVVLSKVDTPIAKETSKTEVLVPKPEPPKIDFSGNQENSDAVEDCININVEEEENFEEVIFRSHFKKMKFN